MGDEEVVIVNLEKYWVILWDVDVNLKEMENWFVDVSVGCVYFVVFVIRLFIVFKLLEMFVFLDLFFILW